MLLTVLGLINAYVFVWRGEGALLGLEGASAAVIGGGSGGPLPPVADPPERACTGDPVRIFEGLDQLIYQEAALTRGSTLRLALLDLGVAGTEIDVIEASIRTHVDLGFLGGSGAPVRIAVDRLGGVRALEVQLAEGRVLQACRGEPASEGFVVRTLEHPLRSDVEVIALTLGRDAELHAAVLAADEKPDLARMIATQLGPDIDFMTEARPGDEITVIVEKRWLGRHFHRYGALLAVRFKGVAARAAHFLYKPEGVPSGVFDTKGRPTKRAMLRSPVGYHRVAPAARGLLPPSLEVVEGRIGAVYRLSEGAPLVAVGGGVIVEVDRDSERGVFVDLELEDGTLVRYGNMLRAVASLDVGTQVEQGQLLGLAGHSGRTAHDRVRLEVWREVDGEPQTIDPMLLTAKGSSRPQRVGPTVPEGQLARYRDDIAARRRALRVARR